MTTKKETSRFYCYDLVTDRIFSDKCAVKGCKNTKSPKQAVCDYHWNKIENKSITEMYKDTPLGDLVVAIVKDQIKNIKGKKKRKELKDVFFDRKREDIP